MISKKITLALVMANLVSLSACSIFADDEVIKKITPLPYKPESNQSISFKQQQLITNRQWNNSFYSSGNLSLDFPSKKFRSYSLGEGIDFSLVKLDSIFISNNQLFYLDYEKNLYHYNYNNINKLEWKIDLSPDNKDEVDSYIGGHVSGSSDVIYATTGTNIVYAVKISTGNILWKKQLNNTIKTTPAVDQGMIIVTDTQNITYALSAQTGDILWNHLGLREITAQSGGASPLIYKNRVIAPNSNGEIYFLDKQTGREIGLINMAVNKPRSYKLNDISHPLVMYKDILYVLSSSGSFLAIEPITGKRHWSKQYDDISHFWVTDDFIFLNHAHRDLVCISRQSGQVLYVKEQLFNQENDKEYYISGPVVANNSLWFVDNKGDIIIFDANGNKINSFNSNLSNIYHRPIIVNNTIAILSNDGKLSKNQ